jgi:hypothetical protein
LPKLSATPYLNSSPSHPERCLANSSIPAATVPARAAASSHAQGSSRSVLAAWTRSGPPRLLRVCSAVAAQPGNGRHHPAHIPAARRTAWHVTAHVIPVPPAGPAGPSETAVRAAVTALESAQEPVARADLPWLSDPAIRRAVEAALSRIGRMLVPVPDGRWTTGFSRPHRPGAGCRAHGHADPHRTCRPGPGFAADSRDPASQGPPPA